MELSDPATPDMNGTADRRKSGRSRHKPVLLNKDPNIPQRVHSSGAKRKRAESRVEDVSDPTDDDMDDEGNIEDSGPDQEELKEQKRKSRSKKGSSKPAAKRPKSVPVLTTNLAVRPAVNGAKKASKPKQPRAPPIKNVADGGTGLYGESFLRVRSIFVLISSSRGFLSRSYIRRCRGRLDQEMGAEQHRGDVLLDQLRHQVHRL